MNKLKLMLSAAGVAALLAVSAQAQTLRWAAQNDILTLDPHSQNHATTNAILQHAYEGLVRYNAKYEVEPSLATKWTYLSPTQVRPHQAAQRHHGHLRHGRHRSQED